MNNIRIKPVLTGLFALLMLSCASCGSTTQRTNTAPVITTINLLEMNETAEITTALHESENVYTDTTVTYATTCIEPVKQRNADMEFFKVNDYLEGKTYCVGRQGVNFTVDSVETDSTGFITVRYTLVVDNRVYKGEGGRFESGVISQFVQDEYCPYITSLYWCEDTENLSYASVIITEETYVPQPLELSGNHDDLIEITCPEYAETDDMVLFMCGGTTIRGDTMEKLSEIIDILEKETGLSFFNKTEYSCLRSDEHTGEFEDVFRYVDYRMQKFHIYVVPEDVSVPCAFNSGIILNPQDIDLDTDCSTLIHELTHAIHRRNGVGLGRIMDEGYATYMTGRILKNHSRLISDFDSESNYSGYNKVITPQNAENIFKESQKDDFNYYLYGYRFMNYLYARYGDDAFRNILKTASDGAGLREYDLMENEKAIPYIKKCTSGKVFEEFAEWLKANQERFDGK